MLPKNKSEINLSEAVSIGIGGMVGGGIFAVLGLAVTLARGSTPLAFIIAGIIATITAYSYARLSLTFPDSGGTVHFINQGFGRNMFTGGTNNLLWISYIIMLSLYSTAFGAYGAHLFTITGNVTVDEHILLSSIVLFSASLNYISFKVVSISEAIAVYTKIIILGFFVVIGIYGLRNSSFLPQLDFSDWVSPFQIISGGMVIFVAYEGFELIANAVPKLKNPDRNVMKAFFISVISVVVLYVLIAIITVGSVSFSKIASSQEYVLAVAAEPTLGKIGFLIIGITALISTFSAINATLYGGSKVNYELAEDDEFPHEFTKIFWNQPIGLLVTTLLTLAIANTLNLESISTAGSAGFLLIFAIVNLSNYKLSVQTKSYKYISLTGAILCFAALITLLYQQFDTNLTGALFGLALIAFSYFIEYLYKRNEKK